MIQRFIDDTIFGDLDLNVNKLQAVESGEFDTDENFNPNQPRDEHGRWTTTSVGGSSLRDFGEGGSGDEVEKYINSNYGNIKYSDEEIDMIFKYAHFEDRGYEWINNYLRKSGNTTIEEFEDYEKTEATGEYLKIKALDSASKRGKLTEDTALYRGVSNRSSRPIQEGQVLSDLAYSSTSLNRSDAENFMTDGRMEGDPFVLRIHAKEGTNVIIPNIAAGQRPESDAIPTHEAEFILPRGSSMKIASIRTAPDKIMGKEYKIIETELL